MKKSIVWTAAAVAAVGFGVPAFAAISEPEHLRRIAPTPVVSVDQPDDTVSTSDDSTTSVSVGEPAGDTVNDCEQRRGHQRQLRRGRHANDADCAAPECRGRPRNLDAQQRRGRQWELR